MGRGSAELASCLALLPQLAELSLAWSVLDQPQVEALLPLTGLRCAAPAGWLPLFIPFAGHPDAVPIPALTRAPHYACSTWRRR